MPAPISSIIPVIATAQGADAATRGLVLQAGTVVDAKVISVLADNLVRIAIANLSMDVLSEVALSPGQNLQLAVSQNDTGIRLAIVGSGGGAGASDTVTLAPAAAAVTAAAPSVNAARNQLTSAEQAAVAVASEAAVTRQGSQAPLFADLAAAANGRNLPPGLRQAVLDVLAQQTPLDPKLSGEDIQAGFQKSGLLMEASLASGAPPSSGTIPDLKAAMLVLRQTLASISGALDTPVTVQASASAQAAPAGATAVGVSKVEGQAPVLSEQAAAETVGAPSLSPDIDAGPSMLAAVDKVVLVAGSSIELPPAATTRALRADGALHMLPEIDAGIAESGLSAGNKAQPQDAHGPAAALRATGAPPPFHGALPSAQPIASPSVAPNAPLSRIVHRLLEGTDAAIARQTLLQVASLPDRADPSEQRIDPSAPQWHFEIPFATPQGIAVAQFEISRDGAGNEAEPSSRVWRARFSLDVEPAGPVHALITLASEKTSVRMWAERPATVARLRAGANELGQALARAELNTGEIVIREGTPPSATPARAGHFLDRAL